MSRATQRLGRNNQPPQAGEWFGWWMVASCGHFIVLLILSIILGWSFLGWFLIVLFIPGVIAEGVLKITTGYRGEDIIQWPIILTNSLLYGAVIVWWNFRESALTKHTDSQTQQSSDGG